MILAATLVTVRLFWLHPFATVRVNNVEYRADRFASSRLSGSLQLEAAGSPRISIEGPLDILARDGHLLITLHVPLEDYVAGVLAGESSIFKSEEALKAMAVAARTYAVRHRGRHRAEGFDFCDTTHCQDLRLAARSERLRAAVEATEAELLWYEGTPADTYYSRHCGGTTEAGDAPYLRQQSDTFCIATGRAEWHCELQKQDLGGAVTIPSRTPSGRVAQLRAGSRRISATDFQLSVGRALGWDTIRSNFYDLIDRGDRILFQGYGSGHGIGLCQIGAEQRGLAGQSYHQILAFYYPGTAPGVGAQGFKWTRMDGERVDAYSTHPHEDRDAVAAGDRAVREAESRSGIPIGTRPRLRIYPTITAFRDATGEPGYVAASTVGRTVRVQPVAMLRGAGKLDATLLHEMLHVAVESQANPKTPMWFREGLVLYLSGTPAPVANGSGPEQDLRRNYQSALARVRTLVEHHGRAAVMQWLRTGNAALPPQ
jgi:stage II sporulation protein D